jgi:hypothetical protein
MNIQRANNSWTPAQISFYNSVDSACNRNFAATETGITQAMQALASGGVALYIQNAATAGSGSAYVAGTVTNVGSGVIASDPGVLSVSTSGLTTTITTTVTNSVAAGIGTFVSTGVADPSTGTNFYGGSGGSIASTIYAPIINAPPPPTAAPAPAAPAPAAPAPAVPAPTWDPYVIGNAGGDNWGP